MKTQLIQQRAIILAVEALAIDFAGWGQLFPVARSRAEAMFARDAGDWPKLVELYLPRERRTDADIVRMFAPSEGSIASARSTVCRSPSRWLQSHRQHRAILVVNSFMASRSECARMGSSYWLRRCDFARRVGTSVAAAELAPGRLRQSSATRERAFEAIKHRLES
jgi:hypothetical protein